MIVIDEIKALLDLFEESVPDKESNRLVHTLCDNKQEWVNAHKLFIMMRERNLIAIQEKDVERKYQYCFEEVCLKLLYNLMHPKDPFDVDSPYWIIKNAFALAQKLNIPESKIVNIVTLEENNYYQE